MKKFTFIAVIFFLSITIPSFAIASKKCQDLSNALMHREAAECYHEATVANPKNPENHYMLGMAYLKLDYYSQAQDSFKRAVAMDAQQNQLVNPAISYIDSSRLNEIKEYLDSAVQKNPSLKNKLANDIFGHGQNRLAEGKVQEAKSLFEFALGYNPGIRSKVFNSLNSAGEKANAREAPTYFHLAYEYASSDDERKQVGTNFLRLAVALWPNNSHESAKSFAEQILGKEKVLEVFPLPYDAVIFDRTYTFDDAHNKTWGLIYTFNFATDNIKVGDKILVQAICIDGSPLNGKEITIGRGEGFTPNWAPTINGQYVSTVQVINGDGFFEISLDKQKELKARVLVTRKIIPNPNFR